MPVSPGNGDVKKQLAHVFAHLLDYAKKDPNFRAAVSVPKFGKVSCGECGYDVGHD
jgi:hypothetical protein